MFGERLRRLRGNRQQKQIASELDMPVTTLSTLERQTSVPRGAVLKRLADYFGVPVSYFYGETSFEMKSSDGAKAWLQALREKAIDKDAIATHASPKYSEEVKKLFAQKIREKKRAQAPNNS
jgi:transcriptional regulator with XRE-family HTH domain